MAENGHKSVDELREDANRELREFGREVRQKADEAKKEVVERLFEAADTIRRETREAKANKDAEQAADNVAKGLEKAAHYLKRRSYEDMGDDVERVVKRRPMRAVGMALVAGIVIGLILRGSSRD